MGWMNQGGDKENGEKYMVDRHESDKKVDNEQLCDSRSEMITRIQVQNNVILLPQPHLNDACIYRTATVSPLGPCCGLSQALPLSLC